MRVASIFASVLFTGFCGDQGRSSAPPPARSGPLPYVGSIEGRAVETLLPPDAIPAIDSPRFVRAADAKFMADEEPVIGVLIGGVARAYSTWALDRHAIVNDVVAGEPVAVTW